MWGSGSGVEVPANATLTLTDAGQPEGAKLAVKCGGCAVPSAAFVGFGEGRTEGVFSLALDENGAVTIGGEEIPVKPPAGQLWADGPIWAECNVGGTEPGDYGNYYITTLYGAEDLGLVSSRSEDAAGTVDVYGTNLSGLDGKMIFWSVTKPSAASGFFTIGVSATRGGGVGVGGRCRCRVEFEAKENEYGVSQNM